MIKSQDGEKWVLMTELNGEPLLHHFKLSNYGRVIKIKKGIGEGVIFEPKEIGSYPYLSFTTKMGSRETIYLHRLVAELFIEPPSDEHEFVIHKDYNRRNNRWQNLEWVVRDVLYKHRSVKAGRKPGKANRNIVKKGFSEPIVSEKVARENQKERKAIVELYGMVH